MTSPSSFPPTLSKIHRWARSQAPLRRFTLANRLLLAMAFLPTGLVKATGQRFTLLGVDTPVGFFFEAMYRTGPYWVFIGLVQVVAALLLLVPRTALLGALTFLPVSASIFLITWGVGFGNTVWVTGLMTLSAIYLVCWDAQRVWDAGARILERDPDALPLLAGAGRGERWGWISGGICGLGLFLVIRGFLPAGWIRPLLLAGAFSALLVMGSWIRVLRTGAPPSIAPHGPLG